MTPQSTIRARQCRARQRDGVLRVGVDLPPEFVEIAIERGYVSEAGALDKRTLGALVAKLLAAWGQGTLPIETSRPENKYSAVAPLANLPS